MSHTVPIDADDAAFMCRRYCDNAIAYLEAKNAAINHGNGLIEAVSASVLSDLILRNLDHRLIDERERFEELRKESRDLMSRFWKFFKLFPITNSDGSTSVAHISSPAPHAAIRHVGEDKLHTNGTSKVGPTPNRTGVHRKHISPDRKNKYREILRGGPWTMKELEAYAREWGISVTSVQRLYYELLQP